MSTPSDSKSERPLSVRRGRPSPGERNRGAVDALQTKIAVNVQDLQQDRFQEQLRDNIAEMPDATGSSERTGNEGGCLTDQEMCPNA